MNYKVRDLNLISNRKSIISVECKAKQLILHFIIYNFKIRTFQYGISQNIRYRGRQ